MVDEIWVSSVRNNSQLGNKLGIREKHYGQDWAPPQFEMGRSTETHLNNVMRASRGEKLSREEFIEAAYVFEAKNWSRVNDLFWIDGFLSVKGKLAELLKGFDLGSGELVEFPIYEIDKTTQLPGPFYFLNFGAQKDCFLPEQTNGARLVVRNEEKGIEVWRAPNDAEDGDIAVSTSALQGADLWIDPKLRGKIFMSGGLHDAIEAAKLKIDFRFSKTRILPE